MAYSNYARFGAGRRWSQNYDFFFECTYSRDLPIVEWTLLLSEISMVWLSMAVSVRFMTDKAGHDHQ